MKKTKFSIYTLFAVLLLVFSNTACENEELSPYLDPLTAVHGYAEFKDGSSQSFVYTKPSVGIDFDMQWISIDSKLTVNKIEVFVLFNESYVDVDGNPRTARHGGTTGILLKTIEGGAVPANRAITNFTVTPDEVYNLYKDKTFDYGTGAVSVFNNPATPDRGNVDTRFIPGDSFSIRWNLYTDSGLKFDSWSPSVCTEFPGANCSMAWGIICQSELAGTYSMTSNGTDDNGDNFSYTFDETFTAQTAAGKYEIADLSGGMEPEVWDNPGVKCVVVDACGIITLDKSSFSYLYDYNILSGSYVDASTGMITISWENFYGENGINVYTPE